MTTLDKVLWWLDSREPHERPTVQKIANALGADTHETRLACIWLTKTERIIGHEQNGRIVYYSRRFAE